MVRIVRVFVCLALVATIIPLGCDEPELPDIEVPEPRDRLVEILQLADNQVEQLEAGTGTLELREDQVDILRDYVMRLLEDVEPWLNEGQWQNVQEILESMLEEGTIDLEALGAVGDVIDEVLTAIDEAEAAVEVYTGFGKLPSEAGRPVIPQGQLREGSERSSVVIVYTPKDSSEGHESFVSGVITENTLGFATSIASADDRSGALGVYSDAIPFTAASTHARHRIVITVPSDNTDVTIKGRLLYTSGTVSSPPPPPVNQASTHTAVAAPYIHTYWRELTYQVVDPWFRWTDGVKWGLAIVSLGATLVVTCLEQAVQTLWTLKDIEAYQQGLEKHGEEKIITYSAGSVAAGTYYFELGVLARASAGIGVASSYVFGCVPEIEVTLDCAAFTLDVTSTGGGEVTEPREGASMRCAGQRVDLVATPHSGYRFVNWTGDVGKIANVNAASTTITMEGNYSITANFEEHTPGEYTPMVAAGWYHTVGVRSDGTVVVVGDDRYGQHRVGGWTDIVQLTAGIRHTVGLKSDGTVVAVGDNYSGQLNVGGWTNIIQVAAGTDYTVGLRADGTVVSVGESFGGMRDVGDWTEIAQVAAASLHTVGVKSDGTVVAAGRSDYYVGVGAWEDIVQVATGWDHTVGLKSDGTVVAVGYNHRGQCNVGTWTDIVQVIAGDKYTVGLRSDGTVVAVGENRWGQCNVGGWTGIVQVAGRLVHTVGLRSDGTVVAVGDDSYGQCDVGGWNLL